MWPDHENGMSNKQVAIFVIIMLSFMILYWPIYFYLVEVFA